MKMNGAEVIVNTLANAHVTRFFGIPGEHCLALIDAVHQNPKTEFVSVRHESAAAFMAEAHAKLTGYPAACVGTASVGAVNLIAGVNVAQHDSTPMIVIAGQVSRDDRGRDAWQELDLDRLFSPLCKFTFELSAMQTLPEITKTAVSLSRNGRPGPIMLSVPVDMQEEQVDLVREKSVPEIRSPGPDMEAIAVVAEQLQRAQKPLLIVGGGIRSSRGCEDLIRFAEAVQLPVATAFRRMDAFPNDSPYWAGGLGLGASQVTKKIVHEADFILAVGTRLSELTTLRYTLPDSRQTMIHIDVDADVLARQWVTPMLSITSDPRLAFQALYKVCESKAIHFANKWWTSIISEAGTDSTLSSEIQRISELAVIIDELLPNDAIVTSDAGDFFLGCSAAMKFYANRRFLGPTSGTMGYGLPAAIAAKLAAPDKICVALCGDGGFMMSSQELETAARCGAAVIAIVFNNSAYGSIVRHQKTHFAGRLAGTTLSNTHIADLANALNVHGVRATSTRDFRMAFERAMNSGRAELIEVIL